MNKLENEYFFEKFPKIDQNCLTCFYKHLLIDLQNIQRIAIGYINSLALRKDEFFRVFEITRTAGSLRVL
jgi:hypothetical protein